MDFGGNTIPGVVDFMGVRAQELKVKAINNTTSRLKILFIFIKSFIYVRVYLP